jgi:hypothetical protein
MSDFLDSFVKLMRSGQDVKYYTLDRELDHLKTGLKRDIGESTRDVRRDLAEALLLLHGLTELLIRRGLISQDELKSMMDEIDLRDGQLNGYLDPMATRSSDSTSLSPKEFLRKLAEEQSGH